MKSLQPQVASMKSLQPQVASMKSLQPQVASMKKSQNPNQQAKGATAPTLQTEEKPTKTNKAATLLAESVTKLMNSDTYKKALTFRKKLYTYSFRNVWLIYCQNPQATMIAGYSKWKELGRQVKKGEKSLAILAPLIKKDKDSNEKEVFGFRSASVFDIEQTEGPDLPELPKPILLTKDNHHIQAAIKTLEQFANQRGNPVSYKLQFHDSLHQVATML